MSEQGLEVTKADLERVRDWAVSKLATGEEPPWAWYQYMKLHETLDAILDGMDSVTLQTENSQPVGPHPGTHLRLVGATDPQDGAQQHHAEQPIPLPM
jgi:hypothetical protein